MQPQFILTWRFLVTSHWHKQLQVRVEMSCRRDQRLKRHLCINRDFEQCHVTLAPPFPVNKNNDVTKFDETKIMTTTQDASLTCHRLLHNCDMSWFSCPLYNKNTHYFHTILVFVRPVLSHIHLVVIQQHHVDALKVEHLQSFCHDLRGTAEFSSVDGNLINKNKSKPNRPWPRSKVTANECMFDLETEKYVFIVCVLLQSVCKNLNEAWFEHEMTVSHWQHVLQQVCVLKRRHMYTFVDDVMTFQTLWCHGLLVSIAGIPLMAVASHLRPDFCWSYPRQPSPWWMSDL